MTEKNPISMHSEALEQIVNSIATGKALLFTGAGFSLGSINMNGDGPPKASELAEKICDLGGFEKDTDLRFASDFYLHNHPKEALIELLKQTFTVKETSEAQKNICNAPWRRLYTTNYDNVMQLSALSEGKRLDTIDLTARADQFYNSKNLCVHINGSISSLTSESLEAGFKLSTSSYISSDTFMESSWYYQFKRDIESCSALVFVGYSMYDIDIQKILFQNQTLKDRTFFVTQQSPSHKSTFTLAKFGTVVPIGTDLFASHITDQLQAYDADKTEHPFEYFSKFIINRESVVSRDKDIENLLFHGHVKQSTVDFAVTSEPEVPVVFIRKELEVIHRFLESGRNTIITSSFGNGKTLLTKELMPYLDIKGFEVYEITDADADFTQDLETINGMNQKSVLLVDNYVAQIDILRYLGQNKPPNILLVATSRINIHEQKRAELKQFEFSYQELNGDHLSDVELDQFIDIVDNVGAWGEKAGYSPIKKKEFLKNENDAQVSLALLSLFESPQIKDRISSLLKFCMDNKKFKDTVFAIALLEIAGLPTTNSFISEVALNDEIYSDTLRGDTNFQQLFKVSSRGIASKSGLFCLSLIKHNFLPSYTLPQLLKVVKKYGERDGKVREENDLFRSLVKFSFIERLLPDASKKTSIKRYYESLKVNVKWLKSDPHFWLQYAMATLPSKEYIKAQQYMDQSYALAQRKINYHTQHHDTQQGRLYLLQALDASDPSQTYELFAKAHSLFGKIDNDIYKFRQIDKYKDYFESCFEHLSKRHKSDFEHACKKMLRDVETYIKGSDESNFNSFMVIKVRDTLTNILDNILSGRT